MKTAFDNGRTNPKVATFAYRFTDLAGNCLQPGRSFLEARCSPAGARRLSDRLRSESLPRRCRDQDEGGRDYKTWTVAVGVAGLAAWWWVEPRWFLDTGTGVFILR